MTDREINIAIAEVRGWEKHEKFHCWKDPTSEKFVCWKSLPDCCNDLNAMHEAEKVLIKMPEKRITYAHLLMNAACKDWAAFHATARQRAEAFLKTLDLWKL